MCHPYEATCHDFPGNDCQGILPLPACPVPCRSPLSLTLIVMPPPQQYPTIRSRKEGGGKKKVSHKYMIFSLQMTLVIAASPPVNVRSRCYTASKRQKDARSLASCPVPPGTIPHCLSKFPTHLLSV